MYRRHSRGYTNLVGGTESVLLMSYDTDETVLKMSLTLPGYHGYQIVRHIEAHDGTALNRILIDMVGERMLKELIEQACSEEACITTEPTNSPTPSFPNP